jgi:hypothetical protein
MAAGATVHLSQRDPPFQLQAIGPDPARRIVAKLCAA